VTDRLRAERFRRGAAAIGSRELELTLDGGEVRSAQMAGEAEAHALVEEQMLVANRRVAEVLAAARAAALHRVHEHPEPESIVLLAQRLAALEVPTPALPEQFSPQEAAALAAEMAASVERTVGATGRGRDAFPSLVLRSLKRARYDRRSLGHSGLAVPAYCHFTSPIRRYPDLICHRALLARIEDDMPVPGDTLDALAEHCSAREREAAALEHRGEDIALAFLLDQRLFGLGWEHGFDGEIVGLAEGGLFVRFGDVFEGLLPARFLGGEWFDRDELEVALVARTSGRRYRLGDPIAVRVRSIDRPRGRVLLERHS
jgi:ribonuclease R